MSASSTVMSYLAQLESSGQASRALRRQRRWALNEALLFAAARQLTDVTQESTLPPESLKACRAATDRITVADLLDAGFVDEWLNHGPAVLRGEQEAPHASQRARVASLRALADYVNEARPAHGRPKPVLRETLTFQELQAAMRTLGEPLSGVGSDEQTRLAAMLAVMSVWPVRSIALSGLTVQQVGRRSRETVLDVDAGPGEPPVILRGLSADRLDAWLALRDEITSALLGGTVTSLWVSIRSNRRPGKDPDSSAPLPPGMPLKPRGMQRAYARAVVAANLRFDGHPGFPLPRSLDLLRRSLLEPRDRP